MAPLLDDGSLYGCIVPGAGQSRGRPSTTSRRRSGRYRAGAIASRSPVRLFRRCLVRFSS
ncbi:hypothetical protein AWV80_36635 [Cupriavidus sp. UYMU48A]|nr:hypothetical protein AWV80_36635 [Cupriavidus sp. UYMU48A]